MSKSSYDRKIEDLNRQLRNEKNAHNETTQRLQREITRWQWMASPRIKDLMGIYPALRRLLLVLTEAADNQDPASGAPIEDTMRTEYVAAGENASTSQTERGVLSHRRHREIVRGFGKELEHLRDKFDKDLSYTAHKFSQTVGTDGEYELPDPPKCYRKGCPKRGVQQPYSALRDGCSGCGRQFELEAVG